MPGSHSTLQFVRYDSGRNRNRMTVSHESRGTKCDMGSPSVSIRALGEKAMAVAALV